MIEKFNGTGLDEIMTIWLDGNIQAHSFIKAEYWAKAANQVREALPASDLYFYRESGAIKGFIGLTDNHYIAGLFVSTACQSRGLGRALLDHCKKLYLRLELDVFTANERALSFYLKNGFVIKSENFNSDFGHREYRLVWPGSLAPEDRAV